MMIFNSEEFNETNIARMDLPYLIAAGIVLVAPETKPKESSVWDTFNKSSDTNETGDTVERFLNTFIRRLTPLASNLGWSPRGHIIYRTFTHKEMTCTQAALFFSVAEGVDESTLAAGDRTVMGVMYDAWRAVAEQGDLHIGHIESYPQHNRDETGQPCAIADQRSFLIAQGFDFEENSFTCVDYAYDFIGYYYY